MAQTLREHHPDALLTVLVLDADPGELEAPPAARMLGMDALPGEDHGLLAAANPPGALCLAALAPLMRVLLDSGEGPVLYLGAGQRVLGPLSELLELQQDYEVAVVARPVARAPAAVPVEAGMGALSRQLLGLRAGRSTNALLAAWPRYFKSVEDDGWGAARAWMDSIPSLVEGVGVLRHPGYGLDPWSLASATVQGTAAAGDAAEDDRGLRVDGASARAVDFSGLDPADPPAWLDGADRIRLSAVPVLAELVECQAEDLRTAGLLDAALVRAPYAQLEDGLRVGETVRALLLQGMADGELARSPFTGAGRRELYAYLNQLDGRGRGAGLTRLHMAIWERRADLRATYPHIDGPDGAGFAGWLCLHGVESEGLVAELLPPTPELAYRDANPYLHEDGPRWGVNVVGFFTAELGVGEAARLLIAGLDAGSVPALPIQGALIPPSRQGHEFAHAAIDEAAYPINILCVNGDGIPVFAREAGRSFFEGRYTIALWFWEVGDPPPSWSQAYEFIDEVWVASQHVYDVIAPTSPVPVVKTRLPVATPELAPRGRAELGLPERGFVFLYAYDYHSVAARKNPLGLIEAFRRAFPARGDAQLVLKSINAESRADDHERVVLAARGRGDITLLDDYVSGAEKNAMIAACDCYVSLHRSEGLGLTVAEAMLLGKPVIATRYGGTLEFTSEENSYLVRCEPVAVGERAYPYAPEAIWAEPDLDHAAALMRHVLDHPQEALDRGRIARRDVLEHHSPAVAGAAMGRRLALVNEHLPTINWGAGRMGRLRWRAQRPVADWSRAYVEHESKIDTETQLAIARLDARVRDVARALHDQQNAHHAEALVALRRLRVVERAAETTTVKDSASADASSEHAQRSREAPAEGAP
jgi:glycosyltransferase involved in cell wall biosynthesis